MDFVRLLPVLLSFLLLAAHFYRAGNGLLVGACVLLPCLLLVRQPWVPRVIQVALLAGAAEWLRTLWFIAQMRVQFEMPWVRMAVILGAVALFTALSGLVFLRRTLRERFSVNR